MSDQKDFGQGIFNMDRINEINLEKNLFLAKEMALKTVAESKAKEENKVKATRLIAASNTQFKLIKGMADFSLAHQGMKVIR